jgi:hypothetical protein
MKRNEEILNELLAISPLLAKASNENVFTVPEGYFNTLNQLILSKTIHNQETLSVPAGYFETLSSKILNRIAEEDALVETKNISPALYSLQNKNVFSVPKGYFENLAAIVLSKVKEPARVINIQAHTIWRYAVAAVLIGVIAVNSLFMFNKPNHQLAAVKFIGSNVPAYISESSQYKTEDDINNAVASLSNEDIINYLENTGTVADNEMLNNEMDTKDLPTQKDYLNDEQALENVLKEIQNTN